MITCRECGASFKSDMEFCPNCETRTRDYWIEQFEAMKNSPEAQAQHQLTVARYVIAHPQRFSDHVIEWAHEVAARFADQPAPEDSLPPLNFPIVDHRKRTVTG